MVALPRPTLHGLEVWVPVDNHTAPEDRSDGKVLGILKGVTSDVDPTSHIKSENSVVVVSVPCTPCEAVRMTLYDGLSTIDSLVKGRSFSTSISSMLIPDAVVLVVKLPVPGGGIPHILVVLQKEVR